MSRIKLQEADPKTRARILGLRELGYTEDQIIDRLELEVVERDEKEIKIAYAGSLDENGESPEEVYKRKLYELMTNTTPPLQPGLYMAEVIDAKEPYISDKGKAISILTLELKDGTGQTWERRYYATSAVEDNFRVAVSHYNGRTDESNRFSFMECLELVVNNDHPVLVTEDENEKGKLNVWFAKSDEKANPDKIGEPDNFFKSLKKK